jgi:hypothetical protein
MTNRKTTHIEVSDLIAVRITCGKCEAVLSVPISPDSRFSGLYSCPNCDAPWLSVPAGPSIAPEVQKCVDAIKRLVDNLKNWDVVLRGRNSEPFSLTFEISAPAYDAKD